MIYRHEIINNNLYLYLDLKEEYSNELSILSKDFLSNNNINYTGDKVYLIINNILVKVIKKDF